MGGFGTNHAAWTSSRSSFQLDGGRVTFLFAPGGAIKGPGPAHNLSMGVGYGEGRTGRGAVRRGFGYLLPDGCSTSDRYWHRYRHRHRCLEMVGGNIATGARRKMLGKMEMEHAVDDLTSDGARVADWRRYSTATATP